MKFLAPLLLLAALAGCATATPPVASNPVQTAGAMAGPLSPTLEQLALSPAEQTAIRTADGTGNGTANRPFKVTAITTEYAFLRQHGLRFERQTVMSAQPVPLDRMTVTRRATGQTEDVFFQCLPESPTAQQVATAIRSMMTAGDGRSMATAWPTTSIPREYAILRLIGLQRARQQLLRGQGQSFDKLETIDPVDQSRHDVYFRLIDMGV